ncbi:MAG: winged helix-turn-helix domain-containing protein, partial [Solirubrobacterales bacterium]|nr:winged helix-turn-helix domain-containing protein [Solirubrobacterales bacterium]
MGILGPFELRLDGGALAGLGGLRQRALLAVLALHPNEVVATDRIIDELWGENAPASATHTSRVFVSRLRRALGSASDRLETVSPGYRLVVDVTEIDADCCRRLYAEACAATEAGRPGAAEAKLVEALALWRGAPLADFTYERFARGAIAQLEELRVSCREELAEAQLALGQHAKVVQDLESLIAEHPLRERPRGQLMLALYRCGRQAEALDAYRQARHMLVEELAIEPSADLRVLEQAILRQDPSLAAPTMIGDADDHPDRPRIEQATYEPGPAVTIGPRTAEGTFVGRDDCLERLRLRWGESQAGRTNLVCLVGEAGIGKTRLAMRFAEEVRQG